MNPLQNNTAPPVRLQTPFLEGSAFFPHKHVCPWFVLSYFGPKDTYAPFVFGPKDTYAPVFFVKNSWPVPPPLLAPGFVSYEIEKCLYGKAEEQRYHFLVFVFHNFNI